MGKISQSRNKNVTSNDSNAIRDHAKSLHSTVTFCFHVHTEIPEIYGYCFKKLGSWQERLVKEAIFLMHAESCSVWMMYLETNGSQHFLSFLA